jgi:RsiW-degrading membrane proteinase PrsW (M82 family)
MSFAETEGAEILPEEGEEGELPERPLPSSSVGRQTLGFLGLVLGAVTFLSACLCGPLLAVVFAVQGLQDDSILEQALGPLVLGLALGAVLALEGWRLWKGRPSPLFYPRRTWPLYGVFLLLMVLGLLVSLGNWAPPFLLALTNVLALFLLPVMVLAAVGRAMRGTDGTWRDVIGGILGGALIGTGLSMVIEVGLALVAVTFAFAFNLVPGGLGGLESLMDQASDPAFLLDPQSLSRFLTPGILLGALFFVSIITPLIEETVKTLGIGLAGRWLRPGPARAFLMGVASGAGFALVENVFNSPIIGSAWLLGIVSRLAATFMHCATGGLVGWAWGVLWARQRPWRGPLAFVGAVALHGVWNGLVVATVASGLSAVTRADDPIWMAAGSMVALTLLLALGVLALMTLAGLIGTGWVLHRRRAVEWTAAEADDAPEAP